jgi:hypothetical protein
MRLLEMVTQEMVLLLQKEVRQRFEVIFDARER